MSRLGTIIRVKIEAIGPDSWTCFKIVRGTIKRIATGAAYRIPPTIDDPAIPDEITADLAALGSSRQRCEIW
jgi:hypothetical protein